MRLWVIVAMVAAGAAGFLVGSRLGPPAAATARAPAPPVVVRAIPPPDLRDEVQHAVRDELAAARAEAAARPVEAPPPPPPVPTPEQLAARGSAGEVVQAAIAAGRWRAEDAQALRALLPTMTDEARRDSLRSLMTAINDQRLEVEVLPPI